MVLQRHDAEDEGAADVVRAARAVYLVGDSSMHLRSALEGHAGARRARRRARRRRARGRRRRERGGAVRPDVRPAWRGVHARPRARQRACRSSPRPRRGARTGASARCRWPTRPFVELPTGLGAGPRPGRLGAGRRRRRSTASCRDAGRASAGQRLGDLDRLEDDLLGRCVARRRGGQGEDRLGDVEALGDLAEHDVGALGVERRGGVGDGEEPLAAGRVRLPPVRAIASWPGSYVNPVRLVGDLVAGVVGVGLSPPPWTIPMLGSVRKSSVSS